MDEIQINREVSYVGDVKGFEVSNFNIFVDLGGYEIDVVTLLTVDQLQDEKNKYAAMIQLKHDEIIENRKTVADLLEESRCAEADLANDSEACDV